MKTAICDMFDIEVPIFAFSHCRDVVVEVSKAGGLGVLGMGRKDPKYVREDLDWIDDHVQGKPYGIDILQPQTFQAVEQQKFDPTRPEVRKQVEFVNKLLDEAGVPPLSQELHDQFANEYLEGLTYTPEEGERMVDIALEHPIKLIVNALGTPPRSLIQRAHGRGIKIAAMAGTVEHAIKHRDAGCDFVIAVGTEAGGHTGVVSSMVLWPRIVDAVAPLPVLGGGGVGRGRQIAAALALGCAGVWCGSIWLPTIQSDVTPAIKARLFAANTKDAVLTKTYTGKSARVLRSRYTDAWDRPDAPPPLPPPHQRYLWESEARARIERAGADDFLVYPVGQIVGDMTDETSVRNVVLDMLTELLETKDRLDQILD
jgi:NAD(P)H-dependent flavin oxidoreductase YrpB (nitropropane dioxygenase family)